jgi:transcriptional regulator with XRE-family HTH domain
MLSELPEQAVNSVSARLAQACRQTRIAQNHTQAEHAALAEISLRAAQNIESGQSGQTAILFKYLFSLGLLSQIHDALPDPDAVSPLEQLAMDKAKPKKPQRVSKVKQTSRAQPKWGDEQGAPESKKGER